MTKNYFASGQHNFICDVCGKKLKSGEGRKRWDGFYVCKDDFEQRHPQDFVRARQDKISVPWSRPLTTDKFVPVTYRFFNTEQVSATDNLDFAFVNSEGLTETTSVTESTTVVANAPNFYMKGFTDSVSVSESLGYAYLIDRNLGDSITTTDSITSNLVTRSLGSAALNELPLG